MKIKKYNKLFGSLAAISGVLMFLVYIPQIMANLSGNKGQPHQPIFTSFSCLLWIIYGFTKMKKDYALIFPNFIGIILTFITFLTSF